MLGINGKKHSPYFKFKYRATIAALHGLRSPPSITCVTTHVHILIPSNHTYQNTRKAGACASMCVHIIKVHISEQAK